MFVEVSNVICLDIRAAWKVFPWPIWLNGEYFLAHPAALLVDCAISVTRPRNGNWLVWAIILTCLLNYHYTIAIKLKLSIDLFNIMIMIFCILLRKDLADKLISFHARCCIFLTWINWLLLEHCEIFTAILIFIDSSFIFIFTVDHLLFILVLDLFIPF